MARKRAGSLQYRTKSWYAVVSVALDGERMRKWVRLDTDNKAVARRKMARLLEQPPESIMAAASEVAAAPETYAELAARVAARRRAEGIVDALSEEGRERIWVLPEIGDLAVAAINAEHIAAVYERARVAGKSLPHLRNLRSVMNSRFTVAIGERTIQVNPTTQARMPRMKVDRRERAVVTDEELAVYLAWQPQLESSRIGVLERQTMSAIARMFGGLRTGDLHVLKWTNFDTRDGLFTWGVAPRKKTARPQRIEVPVGLRPILRDWWERQGRPVEGLVFPVLRGKRAGEGGKIGVSHAKWLRSDLQAAFKAYRAAHSHLEPATLDAIVPAEGSERWKELFNETEFTRPVDFHSWRRRFVQVLADIGLNAQQAQKLAGHSDLAAHERYLRSTAKTLVIPDEAIPHLERYKLSTFALPPTHDPSFFIAPPARVERATFGLGKSGVRRAWLPVSVQNYTAFLLLLARRGDVSIRRFHAVAIEAVT